eukprot:6212619-Pleurochrysis_carterae.AAC.1
MCCEDRERRISLREDTLPTHGQRGNVTAYSPKRAHDVAARRYALCPCSTRPPSPMRRSRRWCVSGQFCGAYLVPKLRWGCSVSTRQ